MPISQKPVNQHKRLAMGDTVKGYKDGGTIASGIDAISVRPGKAKNPLTAVKRSNGIPGYKGGGCKR